MQFIVRKQSLWLVEVEKDILRGARAAPSVGWASREPRLNSRQKQGATRQDLSCGQAGEPPLEGAASVPDKSGHSHAALHAGHLVIAATKLPWVTCSIKKKNVLHRGLWLAQAGPHVHTPQPGSWKSERPGHLVSWWGNGYS